MKHLILSLIITTTLLGCQSKYPDVPENYYALLDSALVKANTNAPEILKALTDAPKNQKEGMAFLISYMPERDLISLKADFLLENAEYAYKARERFPWCKTLPDSIFFNEVLPYINVAETRDPWRKDFYERFSKYVEYETNLKDAIFSIAKPINKEVNVEYNIKRSIVDSSPKEAMAENMATCTGLSIILTDAFRAVGIPSRLAGTPMWTNMKGNHTWCEVYIDNEWKFIEYYPDDLNKSWFLADAGKADPNNPLHWIYAVSYKPTGQYYYAGRAAKFLLRELDTTMLDSVTISKLREWKRRADKSNDKPYIHGVNVTQRYIDLYEKSLADSKLEEDELMSNIVVFKNDNTSTSDARLDCRVDIYLDDKIVDFGYSPRPTDDMNKFLKIKLKKNTKYKAVISNPKNNIEQSFSMTTTDKPDEEFKFILK
ncbi:transglutaminase domain-containing protein [Aestuariibaculum suncheonense]|uniref:Transglutaminase domain-containing protein n=1 Tax=Aestuariibaculum suncheonense TaxID=1028745 RepID=A0A8J6Q823_9FLAO|nr:transglutaminase domain-containing protein [Aestuariibaculum suncheonense]MBD0835909.1 transglutaminase domain-containing protein [Aestuariibaculum suncheonense]